jgi:hypothetical protein
VPTGAAGIPAELHRSIDLFSRTRPMLFSQLPDTAHPLAEQPPNPRSTCTERVPTGRRTLRGLATATRRTSLHAPRVQRFVIECFTPSCQVDNLSSDEPGHLGIMGHSRFDLDCLRRGTRAGPRGNVLERQARQVRGAATTEGGLAV